MSRRAHALLLTVAVLVAAVAAWDIIRRGDFSGASSGASAETSVRDASDVAIPIRRYERIVSSSLAADPVVHALVSPERVVAYGTHSMTNGPDAHRYAGKRVVERLSDVEAVLALNPDIVFCHSLGSDGAIAQLRAAGIAVFDLGHMRGRDSLLRQIRDIARVLDVPERGEAMALDLARQLDTAAADIPAEARPTALYLGVHTGQLTGGAEGTSYHDVLEYGGLRDLAVPGYEGWPAYGPERVLTWDPDYILTAVGTRARICDTGSLVGLSACQHEGHIIELPSALVHAPGPAMVQATRAVRHAVHGPPEARDEPAENP